jgi:hypothetical protein
LILLDYILCCLVVIVQRVLEKKRYIISSITSLIKFHFI